MTDYNLLKEALKLARYAHEGQTDKSGEDYIFHPITVALLCNSSKAKAVALLHDTLEDCKDKVSYDIIKDKVGEDVADAVKLLTNDGNRGTYLEYVKSIKDSGNELAIEVKKADLTMNMDIKRISSPTQKDYDRINNKYKPALAIINGNTETKSAVVIQKVSITDTGLECVVNAANSGLWQGGGVCGYIFTAAGANELTEACNAIGHCEEGSAVITPGFNLSKYIIHAVGPQWIDGNHKEPQKLYGVYKKSLELCKENNIHEVAFPLISAGIFGYPVDKAWRKALQACYDFIDDNKDYNIKIVFAVLDDRIIKIGKDYLDEISH